MMRPPGRSHCADGTQWNDRPWPREVDWSAAKRTADANAMRPEEDSEYRNVGGGGSTDIASDPAEVAPIYFATDAVPSGTAGSRLAEVTEVTDNGT